MAKRRRRHQRKLRYTMLEGVRRSLLPLPNGIEIALLDWGGSGPPLLMHHANGFCAALWDDTARALAGSYRVFAMDARGHGDSSKPAPPDAYAWNCFGEDVGLVARALAAELGVPHLRAGVRANAGEEGVSPGSPAVELEPTRPRNTSSAQAVPRPKGPPTLGPRNKRQLGAQRHGSAERCSDAESTG